MVHKVQLKDKDTGFCPNPFFGSIEEVSEHAAINAEQFSAVISKATRADLEAQLARLRDERRNIQFRYENSATQSGPMWRRRLAEQDSKIGEIQTLIRAA